MESGGIHHGRHVIKIVRRHPWDRALSQQHLFWGLLVGMSVLVGMVLPIPIHAENLQSIQVSLTPQELGLLTMLEQQLFVGRYERETPEVRLNRLEETLFGEMLPQNPSSERLHRIQQVLSLRQEPTRQNHSQQGTAFSDKMAPQVKWDELPRDQTRPKEESDYPAVNEMEVRVLGQSYPQEELGRRLDRLEQRVFGKIQQGQLVDRVDALRLSIGGELGRYQFEQEAPVTSTPFGTPQSSADSTHSGFPPSSTQQQPYSWDPLQPQPSQAAAPFSSATPSADLLAALNQVEKQVFKKTYPTETPNTRLSRLENKIFQALAPPYLSDEERLQRIIAVSAAGGTSAPSKSAATLRFILPVLMMLIPLLL